jgi:Raf kinase inhibitor-like YbhB/YbcL family protein
MWLIARLLFAGPILGAILAGVADARQNESMVIGSPGFTDSTAVPKRYTCSGENISPPLNWSGVPAQAKSLALIVLDPDAPSGVFAHWIVYNLSPATAGLPENASIPGTQFSGASQARNDFGHAAYDGPCPPPGQSHHYHFRIYALSTKLQPEAAVDAEQFQRDINGHVIASAEMTGVFAR